MQIPQKWTIIKKEYDYFKSKPKYMWSPKMCHIYNVDELFQLEENKGYSENNSFLQTHHTFWKKWDDYKYFWICDAIY